MPLPPNWLDDLLTGAVPVAGITGAFAWLTNRSASRTTREGQQAVSDMERLKNMQSQLDAMQERLDKLEAENRDQNRKLYMFGDHLDALSLFWLYGHGDGDFPVADESLATYYDRRRWSQLEAKMNGRKSADGAE